MKVVLLFSIIFVINSLKIGEKGLELIKKYAGCKLYAYRNPSGSWVIGYGITDADYSITKTRIIKGLKITQETADKWLKERVNKKDCPKVNKYYSKYKWTQNEFDALVSLAYEFGSIDQFINNGKSTKADIAQNILKYCKNYSMNKNSMCMRRKEQYNLFLGK